MNTSNRKKHLQKRKIGKIRTRIKATKPRPTTLAQDLNIRSLIDHIEATESNRMLSAIDYKKAFDTICMQLLFKALDLFGFGDHIITPIKTMFKGIKTAVCNAGYSSSFFFPSTGIHQGFCVSPSLYNIPVEFVTIFVRKSIHIKGVQVANSSLRISKYADDSTFFLNDFNSMDTLIQFTSDSSITRN